MSNFIYRRENQYCLLIILISLFIRLYYINSSDLLAEETYYWNYSAHLALGYLDHPPMVGLLIKLFTSLFGTHEFGVRIAAIFCWMLTAFFSYQLTNLIKPKAGLYAITLLAILPFFFIHSLVITPDIPLITCWSAALYYLYRALVQNNRTAWYVAGLWLGLGMLSKYTIVLLGLATLIYMLYTPSARKWFIRKEPYLCVLITLLLFTPVIYWNATHNWVSFAFQTTRRFQATSSFTLHQLLGLLIVFLTPIGVFELFALFSKKNINAAELDKKTQAFILIFALTPIFILIF